MDKQNNSIITFRGAAWLLVFVFYIQFLVAEVLQINWSFFTDKPIPHVVMIIFSQLLAVALPCVVFLFIHSARPSEIFKHEKLGKSGILNSVLIGIAAQPVASLLNAPVLKYLYNHTGSVPEQRIATPETAGGLLLSMLVVALMPAVFEELLMRGIVLFSIEESGYHLSLVVTAFLFALLHNDMTNLLGAFFLGVVLCYVVWMTQSIIAGIITHFAFNAFGMLLNYTIQAYAAAAPWLGGDVFYAILVILSIGILAAATTNILRKSVRRYKTHGLFKQLLSSLLNTPVLLIIAGFVLFQIYIRVG